MSHAFQLLDVLLILPMYLCVYEILILFLFYSPVIVKINIIEHLVFVGIHEQGISVSSAELLIWDPHLYLSIKLLTIGLALNSIEFS